MKNIKKIIHKIKLQNDEISTFLIEVRQRIKNKTINDEEIILKDILNKLEIYKAHPSIIELLGDFLQLIDNVNIYDKYELQDIENLILSNAELNSNDINIVENLIYFYWNVNDDSKKSIELLENAIITFQNKLNILKKLLKSIKIG